MNYRRFIFASLISALAYAAVQLASLAWQSDGGFLAGIGLSDRVQDGIRGWGFPFLAWEKGGFAYRNEYHIRALVLDMAIGVACVAVGAAIGGRTTRRRTRPT